ncbi:MAG: glycosyltransferase family 4 protein [Acidobacteria bacterium]|nr:glycosyltransferase family 4 protein [Acidobacteriota bacterium]
MRLPERQLRSDRTRVRDTDPRQAGGRGRLRITCLIDTLDQGGTQRQLSLLAGALARRGYDIEVMTYLPTQFFDQEVEASGVPVRRLPPLGKLRRAVAVRRVIRARQPDVVIACLAGPGLYAELAGLPQRRFGLIVSEVSVPGDTVRLSQRLRLGAHGLADAVVTQTDHVRRLLVGAAPWLAGRIAVIRNGVDLAEFRAREDEDTSRSPGAGTTRVLVLAGYRPEKNPFGMLAAMEQVRRVAPDARVELDWYGSTGAAYGLDGVYRALRDAVRQRGVEGVFRLHGPVHDVARLYREASVVCLPSFYEGCSNVICEAAASGVPLVVSDICDNRKFVLDGITGFLADPDAATTFADAIVRFHRMSTAAKREMGGRAREHAEALFNPDRFADSYAALIERVARPHRMRHAKGQLPGASESPPPPTPTVGELGGFARDA